MSLLLNDWWHDAFAFAGVILTVAHITRLATILFKFYFSSPS